MEKNAKDEREKILWPMTVCLSSKCNRNCSHCAVDANMNGCFFTPENAEFLTRNIRRGIKVHRKKDIYPELSFTGNGELLLNPDLVNIFDILFGQNPKLLGHLITSGIDSKSPEEANRLLAILSRDYASRLFFHLSFNLFEKRFPKRLIQTLKLLFENGVKKVGIKICQTRNTTLRTAFRLNGFIYSYFIKWVRELDPLASWEAIYDCDLGHNAEEMARDLTRLNNSCNLSKLRVLSSEEIIGDMVWLRSNYGRTLRFKTKFGELQIYIQPHFLSKRGRAVNLSDPGFPKNKHRKLCGFIAGYKDSFLHIGADGCFYPECDCLNVKSLRIGHVRENSHEVYQRFMRLRKILFAAIIADQRHYTDMCQFCRNVSTELYYELIGKSLSA